MEKLRCALCTALCLLAGVGPARAQQYDAICYEPLYTKPRACAATLVGGPAPGTQDAFEPSTPSSFSYSGQREGAAEALGTSAAGDAHAVANASYGTFGALVKAQVLALDDPRDLRVVAHTFVKLDDQLTIVAPHLPAGATVKGRFTAEVHCLCSRGAGGTLRVTLEGWGQQMDLHFDYGNFNNTTPDFKLEKEYDFYVGQVLFVELAIDIVAIAQNDDTFPLIASADLWRGASARFSFDDPRVQISALSGYDYVAGTARDGGAVETLDGGVADAGTDAEPLAVDASLDVDAQSRADAASDTGSSEPMRADVPADDPSLDLPEGDAAAESSASMEESASEDVPAPDEPAKASATCALSRVATSQTSLPNWIAIAWLVRRARRRR